MAGMLVRAQEANMVGGAIEPESAFCLRGYSVL